MGFMKDQMLREEERGWSSTGKSVCVGCVSDVDLKAIVTAESEDDEPCTYCGAVPAASVDTLMEAIDKGIRSEWSVAGESDLSYDGREGGYQGVDVRDSYDLVHEVDISENDDLLQDLIDAYGAQGTQWVRKNFWRVDEVTMWTDAWQAFSDLVKNESRFVFLIDPNAQKDYGDDYIPPGRFLERLAELVVELNLVTRLPAGTAFHRARAHDPTVTINLPEGLAAPHREHARFANRMSPMGIPMFYGAYDRETCLAELGFDGGGADIAYTTGEFRTAREVSVLNLTKIPPVPGLFEPNEELAAQRANLIFLRDFQRDISKPIEKDDRAHIDYVPTQVVTEFFRRVFKDAEGSSMRGILYPSAQREGGTSCVLFFENDETCEIHPGWQAELIKFPTGSGPPRWWLGMQRESVKTFTPGRKDEHARSGGRE